MFPKANYFRGYTRIFSPQRRKDAKGPRISWRFGVFAVKIWAVFDVFPKQRQNTLKTGDYQLLATRKPST